MTEAAGTGALASADIKRIMELLPHRPPFLMIDRVIDMVPSVSATGIKNVTFNEPQFAGHFPGMPVMPGVLLIEAMAQTAGALVVHSLDITTDGKVVYFMTIDNAKFRKPVVPGDVVHYHMTKTRQRANMWWFRGEAKVDGKVVCEADVSAMLVTE